MSEMNIAEKLKALRSLKGVNQDVAAEACGISRIGLARYETGQRAPRAAIAAKLAAYYGVSLDYLLGSETEQDTQPTQKAPADMRAEAKALLEGLSDEGYRAALEHLKLLKRMEEQK